MLKLQPALIILLFISLISLSAKTTSTTYHRLPAVTETNVAHPAAATAVVQHKLNFFQRALSMLGIKKYAVADTEKADRRAKISLILGIAAVGTILLGFAVPFLFLLTIPTGLVAMLEGSSALNLGTNLTSKARTGKALGIGAIIGVLALVVVAIVAVGSAWGG